MRYSRYEPEPDLVELDQRHRDAIVEQRKLSPKFPSVAELLARRQRRQQMIAARVFLVLALISMVYGIVWHEAFGYIAESVFFVGFVVTCWVIGTNRPPGSPS